MTLPVSAADVVRFRGLVRARFGMALGESRGPDVVRAVRGAAAAAGVDDVDALYGLLGGAAPGGPVDAFVSGLNVSETHFFRDAGQMQALEQRILPELIAGRRRERRLRVWSAGCSTGEEAYTLAMLLHRLVPDWPEWDLVVLGTDVNGRSLDQARQGVYRAWSLRGMPHPARSSYLLPRGADVAVAPTIRGMVTFAQLNLTGTGYPGPSTGTDAMDLILCRNVLLYFDEAGARAVVTRLRDALRAGGWLLLSQVEAGLGLLEGLRPTGVGAAFRRGPETTAVGGAGPVDLAAVALPLPAPGSAEAALTLAASRGAVAGRLRAGAAGAGPGVCAAALGFWRDGQRAAALGLLADAAAGDPLHAEVQYLYGLVLLDSGRAGAALAAFRRCAYVDPAFAPAHLGLAVVFAQSGQRRRSVAALDTATRLVDGLDPAAGVGVGAGLRVGEIRELIAAQRLLLDPVGASAGIGGRR